MRKWKLLPLLCLATTLEVGCCDCSQIEKGVVWKHVEGDYFGSDIITIADGYYQVSEEDCSFNFKGKRIGKVVGIYLDRMVIEGENGERGEYRPIARIGPKE
jgi:hypothetical protein